MSNMEPYANREDSKLPFLCVCVCVCMFVMLVFLFAEENIRSVYAYITDLKERIAKLQYQKQLLAFQVKIVCLQLHKILIEFLCMYVFA